MEGTSPTRGGIPDTQATLSAFLCGWIDLLGCVHLDYQSQTTTTTIFAVVWHGIAGSSFDPAYFGMPLRASLFRKQLYAFGGLCLWDFPLYLSSVYSF